MHAVPALQTEQKGIFLHTAVKGADTVVRRNILDDNIRIIRLYIRPDPVIDPAAALPHDHQPLSRQITETQLLFLRQRMPAGR